VLRIYDQTNQRKVYQQINYLIALDDKLIFRSIYMSATCLLAYVCQSRLFIYPSIHCQHQQRKHNLRTEGTSSSLSSVDTRTTP